MPVRSTLARFLAVAALALAGLALTMIASAYGAQAHHGKRAHAGNGHHGRIAVGQARRVMAPGQRRLQNRSKALLSKPRRSLLFHGDRIRDFAVAQSAPGAMTEVPDPAGSGQTVFKMTVSDSDGYPVTPTENPRAELLSPANIEDGDEIWWSAKFFLPADFPAATPNFVTLLQGPYGQPWDGTPPFHIEANNGVLKWQRNSTYDWDIPWEMPEVRGRWVSFLIHERFASDGFLEMWVDGKQVTFFSQGTYNPNHEAPTTRLEMATMDSSNNALPNSIYLQQYRKKGMYPSLTVYQGPLSIGTTRGAVEG